MINQQPAARAAGALIGAAACWGIATVMTKVLLAAIPPLTLLTIQLTTSVLLLWTLVLFTGRAMPKQRDFVGVGLLGLLNPGISYTLSLLGLTTTTASMSTLLWASEPVLILGLAWLILRETLTPKLLIFALVAMGGVILVGMADANQLAGGRLTGNLLILGGVLCCALYTVLAQRARHAADPLVAVAVQQSFALLWALAILPLEIRSNSLNAWFSFDSGSWFWAMVSGIVYYALAFWFYLQGLARVSATVAGQFINLIPIFGVGTAYLFLQERLAPGQWLGACAILLAVFAILREQDQPTHDQKDSSQPSLFEHKA